MNISLIAAVGKNNEIGCQNQLLWHIKEDFEWFKYHTNNKPIVMGRSTYESIGRPLKNRKNFVLSRDKNYKPHPDVTVLHSVEEVLNVLGKEDEVMIIGGANVYEQFLPYANKLYITVIDKEFVADTYFPKVDLKEWFPSFSKAGTEDTGFDYWFRIHKKKPKLT